MVQDVGLSVEGLADVDDNGGSCRSTRPSLRDGLAPESLISRTRGRRDESSPDCGEDGRSSTALLRRLQAEAQELSRARRSQKIWVDSKSVDAPVAHATRTLHHMPTFHCETSVDPGLRLEAVALGRAHRHLRRRTTALRPTSRQLFFDNPQDLPTHGESWSEGAFPSEPSTPSRCQSPPQSPPKASPLRSVQPGGVRAQVCPFCGETFALFDSAVDGFAPRKKIARGDSPNVGDAEVEKLYERLDLLEGLLERLQPQAAKAAQVAVELVHERSLTARLGADLQVTHRFASELLDSLLAQTQTYEHLVARLRGAMAKQQKAELREALHETQAMAELQKQLEEECACLEGSRRESLRSSRAMEAMAFEVEMHQKSEEETQQRWREEIASCTESESAAAGAAAAEAAAAEALARKEAELLSHKEALRALQERPSPRQLRQRRHAVQQQAQRREGLRAVSLLLEGAVMMKLSARKMKWQERFAAVARTSLDELRWSASVRSKSLGRGSTSLKLRDIMHISYGEGLPELLRPKTCPWCCFTLWSAKRSYCFWTGDAAVATAFVIGLSVLSPSASLVTGRDMRLHYAYAKLGRDARERGRAVLRSIETLQRHEGARAAVPAAIPRSALATSPSRGKSLTWGEASVREYEPREEEYALDEDEKGGDTDSNDDEMECDAS